MRPGEIRLDGLSRRFRVRARGTNSLKSAALLRSRSRPVDVWALRDVSFGVEPGSALALVGRNGSGKSTLLRIVAGIIKPTQGRLEVGGRIGTLLELGAGFHPDFTGRENVYLNGSILGLKRAYIRERFDEIVAFAELEEFIDVPVRTYSSGMFMRLGFAVASHLDADVLLLDEVFAVGDGAFQRKCIDRVLEFKRNGGTIVFVSHDASAVERLCERAVLLREGRVEFDGPTHEALTAYQSLLADERDPAERAGGLTEWGSGEARIVQPRVCDPAGAEREHFDSGEPFSLRLTLQARVPCRRRGWPTSSATRATGCSRAAASRPRTSAGRTAPASSRPASTCRRSRSRTGGSTSRSRSRARKATCTTASSTSRPSRSIPEAASAAPCCSTARGREGKSPPPQK